MSQSATASQIWDFPRIISADDHVVEPAGLWVDRLPRRQRERGPHVVRERIDFARGDGNLTLQATISDDGQWADVWYDEERREPIMMIGAAVGFSHDDVALRPITFDEMRPGCYEPAARLADMDTGGIDASLCFPNLAPVRFCGQGFLEAKDKQLAMLCVRAYNDFILEEWCAGSAGRLIPCGIIPLWDPDLAADEVRRVASRGMRAICFSEAPSHLGLPSIHTGHWDPLFVACQETNTVVMIHVGSSSRVPLPSDDAPAGEGNVLISFNSTTAMIDWLFSGLFVRYPKIRMCLAECQIGWVPYYLQRADMTGETHRGWAEIRDKLPNPPSTYFASNVYVTFYDDTVGLKNLEAIGADNVLVETDYPHSDSTWPDSLSVIEKQVRLAGVSKTDTEKIVRGNAIGLFWLSWTR